MTQAQMNAIITAQVAYFTAIQKAEAEDAKMAKVQADLTGATTYVNSTSGLAADLGKMRQNAYDKLDVAQKARDAEYELAAAAHADLDGAQLAYVSAINGSRQTGATELVG